MENARALGNNGMKFCVFQLKMASKQGDKIPVENSLLCPGDKNFQNENFLNFVLFFLIENVWILYFKNRSTYLFNGVLEAS